MSSLATFDRPILTPYYSIDGLIMGARRPLPSHDRTGPGLRRWAAAVMTAEVEHARNDFWRAARAAGLTGRFDRDDGFGGHDAPFRFAHEVHAVSALNWLVHLQAHESDRHGPWSVIRWQIWGDEQRQAWTRQWWRLARGVVRCIRKYRAARLNVSN